MSSSSEDGRWAASKLAERLLREDELDQFSHDALDELDVRTFHRRRFKILGDYLDGLRNNSQNSNYGRILRILGTRVQRIYLSGTIEIYMAEDRHSSSIVIDRLGAAETYVLVQSYLEDEPHETVKEESEWVSSSDTNTLMEMLGGGVFEKGGAFKLFRKQVRELLLGRRPLRFPWGRETNLPRYEEFLRDHFDEAVLGEDKWIWDLLKLGYSNEEMTRLLYGSKFDSPWIYYEPTASMTLITASVRDHRCPCPYKLLAGGAEIAPQLPQQYGQGKASEDEVSAIPDNPEETPLQLSEDMTRAIEHFCGLGGVPTPGLDDLDDEGAEVEFENEHTKAL